MEVPIMKKVRRPAEPALLNVQHARWVSNVLNMLIAVVGKETILGLLLGGTRAEIASLLRTVEPAAETAEPPARRTRA